MSAVPRRASYTAARAPSRALDVLVVDDHESSARALCAAVMSLGHRCRVARSGSEGLKLHHARRADVIVADWTMPGMDGMELCRQVRQLDSGTYTYLLFTSSVATKRDFVEAVRAGADDCLSKPIDVDDLEARLIAADRVVRAYRALAERNVDLRHDSRQSFIAARVDTLTGVSNRLSLEEDLQALQARVSRYGRPACIAMCDIDGFKRYNDHYGHLAGDDALRAIAQAIRASVREVDHVYRYGGEEFLVILPEQAPDQAAAAMARVLGAVRALGIVHAPQSGRTIVTMSIGIASVNPGVDTSVRHAVAHADRALYRAKEQGGDTQATDGPWAA
jgi:diguanylate cyclase (GGDEF)-like protein